MRCEVRAAPVKRVGMLGINGRKLSNTELVERLRVAEADATETLINTYGARAHWLALHMPGNEADAEEVAQDALWSVVRRVECSGATQRSGPRSIASSPMQPTTSCVAAADGAKYRGISFRRGNDRLFRTTRLLRVPEPLQLRIELHPGDPKRGRRGRLIALGLREGIRDRVSFEFLKGRLRNILIRDA